jgi:DNA-binding MarR family transcriptional regulator
MPAGAKCVYATACLEPLSVTDLAKTIPMSRTSVKHHVNTLICLGWVAKVRQGRRVLVIPTAPTAVQERFAEELRQDLAMAVYAGEARMKVLIDEIVVSRDFVDNARPDFLRSPLTEFNLEADRYHRRLVMWDYRGAQHRGATTRFPDRRVVYKIRVNDILKSGLSSEEGIPLIVVTKADLSIEGVQKLVPTGMKTWPLVEGPYLAAIRQACEEYQKMDTGEEQLPGAERSKG